MGVQFNAREVFERVMNPALSIDISDDEWIEINDRLGEWLATNPPEEEKRLFIPLGAGEKIAMMVDGIHYERKIGRYAPDYVPEEGITIIKVR